MRLVENPHRDKGALAPDAPFPSVDVAAVSRLLERCPKAAETPLALVRHNEDITLYAKDERNRMGLGSFKALGAAYVIACDAEAVGGGLSGRCYMTASAGNHGLSVAAGARVFGAKSVVYIADTVPESFAERLRAKGAEVRREGQDYAESMAAAETTAEKEGAILLSDSSWPGYTDIPHRLMEGYLQMAAEAARQCPDVPTHILLQAGVGGLAGAVAAYARHVWGDAPRIVIVEPDAAPALQASIEIGACATTEGPDSSMGRLDCKTPSLIALNGLARDADTFLTLTDAEVEATLPLASEWGLHTSPSGGAGLAAVIDNRARRACGIGTGARVLVVVSEGPQ